MAVSNDKWHQLEYLAKNANCIANVGYSNLLTTDQRPVGRQWYRRTATSDRCCPDNPRHLQLPSVKLNRARFHLDKCDFGFS